ncbi:glycosyltransferase family 1 protein [Pedobacter hiemivivus]|uniref:Glycosyltransferase family 1 protein n=1 Tax=Pedobacter hiemivivus TaxID=2530454 RepID=A0A4U1GDI9_9SPHI|nr:glycosyltransferase [Pedobacter hiemivivus]TKC59272.1 glycosyltransferase family 1 protein [Pedobacter hiemivivus]
MSGIIEGRDIIIVGQQPWDTEIGSNCKNIALELSKYNRVLYINSPLDRITLFRNKKDLKIQKRLDVIKGRSNGLVKVKDQLWNYYPDCMVESINWINSTFIFSYLNKFNNKKLARSIGKAIASLNFNDIILFNDNEIFKGFYLNDLLKPAISIYYSRDYMVAVDYWKKHGEKLEPQLIANNDLCFANSTYLADYCKKYNPKSYYVGQGCDIDDFQNPDNLKRPDDLVEIKDKIIGYVGSLNSLRLDIEVIEHIAIKFPDYHVVLVGPEDDTFKASNLHNLGNVYFFGQKGVNELPGYVNAFDVCINPQVINEVTIGNYPRKIDEYLSLGKPTVATQTKTMEVFKEHVYLANNKTDYIDLIKMAIKENNESLAKARIDFVSGHTWGNSVKLMSEQILIFLNSNK